MEGSDQTFQKASRISECLKIRHNSSNYYPLKDVIPFMALKEELIGKILLPAMEKYFEQIFQQMRIDGQFTPTWGLGDNTKSFTYNARSSESQFLIGSHVASVTKRPLSHIISPNIARFAILHGCIYT